MPMRMPGGVCDHVRVSLAESIERLARIRVETEIVIASASVITDRDPLLMVPHQDRPITIRGAKPVVKFHDLFRPQ